MPRVLEADTRAATAIATAPGVREGSPAPGLSAADRRRETRRRSRHRASALRAQVRALGAPALHLTGATRKVYLALQRMLFDEATSLGASASTGPGMRLSLELLAGSYLDYQVARKWLEAKGHTYTAMNGGGGMERRLHPEVAVAANAHKQMLVLVGALFHVSKAQAPRVLERIGAAVGAPQDFTIVQGGISSSPLELQDSGT